MEELQEHKKQQEKELHGRFYAIEVFIVTVSSSLLYYFCVGDTPNDSTIPFTNLVVKNVIVLRQILFGLVIAGSVALDCEWLRYRDIQKNISDTLQYVCCLLCSIAILLITYPSIVQNTLFQSVSRWQWLAIVVFGMIFGGICSNIRNELRFIRPKEYAKQVHALRIPFLPKIFLVWYGIFGILMIGFVILINSLWGQHGTIYLYLTALIMTAYFFIRCQLTLKAEDINKYRKIVEKADNFAYETYAAPLLLPPKLNNDETPIQLARRTERNRFRDLNVQTLETIDISMFEHIDQAQMDDSICVDISCMGQSAKINVPMVFIYEAFQQLQHENINNDDELLQESIFWATIFVVAADQYKNVPQTRSILITRFVFAGFHFAVALLLKLGKCDLNELQFRGWSPLLAAAAQGEAEIAATLLFYGANPDKSNLKGITPLMYTARYNHHKTCEVLLGHFPNLNLQDEYGSTAIIVTVQQNAINVFDLLLDAGADLSIKDNKGKTALDWAYQCGLGDFANKIKKKLNATTQK